MAKTPTPTDDPAPKRGAKSEPSVQLTSAQEPYPTGDPKGPQTWAEINGFVPVGTGPLAPETPV